MRARQPAKPPAAIAQWLLNARYVAMWPKLMRASCSLFNLGLEWPRGGCKVCFSYRTLLYGPKVGLIRLHEQAGNTVLGHIPSRGLRWLMMIYSLICE
eukprot:COSAG05_NODE_8_length_40675_cov_148.837539_3_plen_98_part_00